MDFLRVFILYFILSIPVLGLTQEVSTPKGNFKFFENKGQWPNGVLYRAKLNAGNIWLEQGRVLYHFMDYSNVQNQHIGHNHHHKNEDLTFKQDLIAVNFLGSNEKVETKTKYPTKEYHNYFLGNVPERWASGVYGFHHVEYQELYPGINLRFFEQNEQLKYEFHLAPFANSSLIKMTYDGAEKIKVTKEGNLLIQSNIGVIREKKPFAYQIKNGRIVEVKCQFNLTNNQVTYALGEYDHNLELIIDPELIFSTYSGAESDNFGMTATYAYDGKGYSGGTIYGNSYPAPAPGWNTSPYIDVFDVSGATTDVFISKYSADGTSMIWTNFIGGGDNTQGTETVHSLVCDKENNIYLYGATSSTDFPIEGGFQTEHGGGSLLTISSNGARFGSQGTDIYIAKISSDGMNLLGSTYIGGSANDGVNYNISGGTYPPANYDSLSYNYGDQFRGEIMVDSLGFVFVTSSTWSNDFPVESGFQMTSGGHLDAVIFKLSDDFSSLVWSSYFGGSENDAGYSVKLDSSYNVVFAGGTSSSDLLGTAGGIQPTYNGGITDGFICKIPEEGDVILQSSFIGTSDYDQVFFVEIDRWDNVYLLGQSLGAMPVSADVYSNPGSSQFIWKLNSDLNSIEYSTVFGNGSSTTDISPSAFLVDVCGNVYVSGWGGNILTGVATLGMPTTDDAFDEDPGLGFNFYMIVFERNLEDILYATYMGGDESRAHVDGGTSRFDSYGIVYQSVCGGCVGFSDFPATAGAWSEINESDRCNNVLYKFDFEIVPVAKFEVDLLEGCAPLTLTFDNESNDTVNFSWDFGPGSEIIEDGVSPTVLFDEPGVYEVVLSITDTICNLTDTAVKLITVHEELELEIPDDTIVCEDFDFEFIANSNGTAISFEWSESIEFDVLLNDHEMDSTIEVNPITSTTYYIKASNGWELCDIIDSLTVTFVDGSIDVLGDTTICLGDTTILQAINLLPEIGIDFDWSPNEYIIYEEDGLALAVPPTSMYFYLTAISELGCTLLDSVWVEVQSIDLSAVYATATPEIVPEGGTTTLEAFPTGFDYQWFPPDGLSNPYDRITNAVVNQDRTYTVIMDDGVCGAMTTVSVKSYEFVCGDVYVFVPSAFSPNNDGENDKLFVRGQNLEKINLKVFDRWGELVFETTDQGVGWDGTFKGENVDPDVYVYHLQVICFDGQENLIKGNVTVLR